MCLRDRVQVLREMKTNCTAERKCVLGDARVRDRGTGEKRSTVPCAALH